MIQRSGGASFVLEPAQAIRVGGERLGQHLDRDIAAQARVMGTIHFPHAPGTEERHDAVAGEDRPWIKRPRHTDSLR